MNAADFDHITSATGLNNYAIADLFGVGNNRSVERWRSGEYRVPEAIGASLGDIAAAFWCDMMSGSSEYLGLLDRIATENDGDPSKAIACIAYRLESMTRLKSAAEKLR